MEQTLNICILYAMLEKGLNLKEEVKNLKNVKISCSLVQTCGITLLGTEQVKRIFEADI